MKELLIPSAALEAADAIEILRVWVAGDAQHVSLQTGVWSDPGAWGIMLADLARHIARSYESAQGMAAEEAMERLRSVLSAELAAPTDEPKGGLV
jgi:hypothetical protein